MSPLQVIAFAQLALWVGIVVLNLRVSALERRLREIGRSKG